MATDVILDQNDGTTVVLDARVVKMVSPDIVIDFPARRRSGGLRRALVHDESDGLTVNFNGDYPGGVTISGGVGGVTINGELVIRDGEPIRGGITINGPITINGGIGMSRNLNLTGDIQFEIRHFNDIGDILSIPLPTETVSLAETIKSLRADIAALQNRITMLEVGP